MKIIYADMPIAQAKSHLNVLGIRSPHVLDYKFGYSALKGTIEHLQFSDLVDTVYLTNSPSVVDLIKDFMKEDSEDGMEVFVNSLRILHPDLELVNPQKQAKEAFSMMSELFGSIFSKGEKK